MQIAESLWFQYQLSSGTSQTVDLWGPPPFWKDLQWHSDFLHFFSHNISLDVLLFIESSRWASSTIFRHSLSNAWFIFHYLTCHLLGMTTILFSSLTNLWNVGSWLIPNAIANSATRTECDCFKVDNLCHDVDPSSNALSTFHHPWHWLHQKLSSTRWLYWWKLAPLPLQGQWHCLNNLSFRLFFQNHHSHILLYLWKTQQNRLFLLVTVTEW